MSTSPWVDTHAHLDAEEFDADRDAVIARARRAGVTAIVCPAISADSSQSVLRLAQTHQGLYAAVGIQPNYCAQAAPDDWDRIVAMVSEPGVVALGETGLDRYWDYTPFDVQQDYFDRHLRLAQARDLPVIIHCREASADLLPMLREAAARGPLRGVLHSFSGDRAMADECLALGLAISFSGAVTYTNKKFEPLREAARAVPSDRLLVETDSPYLVPQALRGKEKRNEPAHVALTAQRLAELRGVTLDEVAFETAANARRLFRLGAGA
ncbi:MAG: TatD family hydrolase [Thermoguttaceae bacterium]|jgi:TatD DNase family protein|nr:TatD family hydrolase [Thermoguttaceae bacterium]